MYWPRHLKWRRHLSSLMYCFARRIKLTHNVEVVPIRLIINPYILFSKQLVLLNLALMYTKSCQENNFSPFPRLREADILCINFLKRGTVHRTEKWHVAFSIEFIRIYSYCVSILRCPVSLPPRKRKENNLLLYSVNSFVTLGVYM
jgi:hypothetical protein